MRYEISGNDKYQLRAIIVSEHEYSVFQKMLTQYSDKWINHVPTKIDIHGAGWGMNHFEFRLEGDVIDQYGERVCLECLHTWSPKKPPYPKFKGDIAKYNEWRNDKRNWVAWHMCPNCYSQTTFANDSQLTKRVLVQVRKTNRLLKHKVNT